MKTQHTTVTDELCNKYLQHWWWTPGSDIQNVAYGRDSCDVRPEADSTSCEDPMRYMAHVRLTMT